MRLTLADVLSLAGDSDELLDHLAEALAPRPVAPSDLVEFFQVPTGNVFNVEPRVAMDYFKAKGLKPTFSYADMLDEAHDSAFTVAKMMDVDMLAQVQASLSDAMANGIPFSQWRDEIVPVMQAGGWWGKKNVVDPVTGQTVLARLGTPNRLKTIFRTNMAASYAAGQWKEIEATKDNAPWLMYDAVDDYRTRPEHASWDRTVLKVGDPWWNNHYPPNGYNCRCNVIQLSDDEVAALGLAPDPPGGPQNGTYDWRNPRTGFLEALPWGIDPGFSHHSGKYQLKQIKKVLKEKIDVLPASMQASALEGVAQTMAAAEAAKELAAAELMAAAAKAQKELAKAAGVAHLKHAVAKAHAQAAAVAQATSDAEKAIKAAKAAAAEAVAKEKLDAIVKGGGANTYEKAALKKLLSDNAWSALPPSERLAAFENLATQFKAKQLTDTKLAKYKAAVLAGKTPPPNVAKVLDEITPDAKAAFLAKIDAEVTAAKAAKEAAEKAAAAQALDKEFEAYFQKAIQDLDLDADGITAFETVKAVAENAGSSKLDVLKGYVSNYRKAAVAKFKTQAEAIRDEVGGTDFDSIPGGQVGPLGKELTTLFDDVYDTLKALNFEALDVKEAKDLVVGKWAAKWTALKEKIAAAQIEAEEAAFIKQTKTEIVTLRNEAHDLGTPEGHALRDAIDADIASGKLGQMTMLEIDGYKLAKSEALAKATAAKASLPGGPDTLPNWSAYLNYQKNDALALGATDIYDQIVDAITSGKWAQWADADKILFAKTMAADLDFFKKGLAKTPTASKQWLNVDAAANQVFNDAVGAGELALADDINKFISSPSWKEGDFTLKAKKIQIAAWKDKLATLKATPKAAAPAGPSVGSSAPQSGVDSLLATKPPNPATLTQIGPQKGSNPGGLFQDTKTGEKFYVKFFDSNERARNELLAGKLYELVGAETPELAVFDWPDGRTALSSRWVDGLKGKLPPSTIANAEGAHEFFAADAWLANWDVVGMEFDNLVLKGTKAFRVDVGGALRFRAQGTAKGAAFGDTVDEIDTLRNGTRNSQAVAVFKDIPDDAILASVRRVLKPSDDQIRQLVEAFGPTSKAERDKLLKTLLARREDLRKRFPAAAPSRTTVTSRRPQQGKVRVTDELQKEIVASRGNGYTINTDGGDIEDHAVLVAQMIGRDGQTFTRTTLKLTPAARERTFRLLQPKVRGKVGTKALDDVENANFADTKAALLQWAKGVNYRRSKGEVLEAKDIERANNAKQKIKDLLATLDGFAGKLDAAGEVMRVAHMSKLRDFSFELDRFIYDKLAIPGKLPPREIPKLDLDTLPDLGEYKRFVNPVAVPKVLPQEIKWAARDYLPYEPTKLDRGRYTILADKKTQGTSFGAPILEGTGPNGERILAVLDPSSQRAPYGTVIIDTPGADALASTRAFELIQENLGVDASFTTEAQRSEQYLNAFARAKFFSDTRRLKAVWDEYRVLDAQFPEVEARVRAKLDFIKRKTGLDVEASEGWRTRDGVEQAFGHGRASQIRPDTDSPEWRKFEAETLVYHNPSGLGTDAGDDAATKVMRLIDSGGNILAQMERLRRGIYGSGSSTTADRNSGGAAYVFTRLAKRGAYDGTGFYWKGKAARRLDAISYSGDLFGATDESHLLRARKFEVSELESARSSYGNETIFKHGLSIFDDLEAIVVEDRQVGPLLMEIRSHGYTEWPDGRKLEDVIVGRTKWRTRQKTSI